MNRKKHIDGVIDDFPWRVNRRSRLASYREARAYVMELGLKSQLDWKKCPKSEFPDSIPKDAERVYKKTGEWVSFPHFIGKTADPIGSSKRISFAEVKKFVHGLGLKRQNDWIAFAKTNQRPDNICASVRDQYPDEWVSWGDFLGTGSVHRSKLKYVSYDEARAYAITLNLNGEHDWIQFSKNNTLPPGIPGNPYYAYKKRGGWVSWGRFLGTERKQTGKIDYMDYEDAKKIVVPLGIKNRDQWIAYCRSGKKPEGIPTNIHAIYKKKGQWVSLNDFLGKQT